jgi:hypothetical protein
MPIVIIESAWRETLIRCKCLSMMYSDGRSLPVCPDCLSQMTLHDLLQWLITDHAADLEIFAEQVMEEMG